MVIARCGCAATLVAASPHLPGPGPAPSASFVCRGREPPGSAPPGAQASAVPRGWQRVGGSGCDLQRRVREGRGREVEALSAATDASPRWSWTRPRPAPHHLWPPYFMAVLSSPPEHKVRRHDEMRQRREDERHEDDQEMVGALQGQRTWPRGRGSPPGDRRGNDCVCVPRWAWRRSSPRRSTGFGKFAVRFCRLPSDVVEVSRKLETGPTADPATSMVPGTSASASGELIMEISCAWLPASCASLEAESAPSSTPPR